MQKIAIRGPNKNGEKILYSDGITTYPHGRDMSFMKYFDDEDKDKLKIYLILLTN